MNSAKYEYHIRQDWHRITQSATSAETSNQSHFKVLRKHYFALQQVLKMEISFGVVLEKDPVSASGSTFSPDYIQSLHFFKIPFDAATGKSCYISKLLLSNLGVLFYCGKYFLHSFRHSFLHSRRELVIQVRQHRLEPSCTGRINRLQIIREINLLPVGRKHFFKTASLRPIQNIIRVGDTNGQGGIWKPVWLVSK